MVRCLVNVKVAVSKVNGLESVVAMFVVQCEFWESESRMDISKILINLTKHIIHKLFVRALFLSCVPSTAIRFCHVTY